MKKFILFTLALLSAGFVGGVTNYSARLTPENAPREHADIDIEGFISSIYGAYPAFAGGDLFSKRPVFPGGLEEQYVEAGEIFSLGAGDLASFYEDGISGLLSFDKNSFGIEMDEYVESSSMLNFTQPPGATFSAQVAESARGIRWALNDSRNNFFLPGRAVDPTASHPVDDDTSSNTPTPVPEPASLLLLTLGLAGVIFVRRRIPSNASKPLYFTNPR